MKKYLLPILLLALAPLAYGQNTAAGNLLVQQTIKFTGTITPSTITSGVNDYAPTGFSTAAVVRLSADAPRTVTGLAGGAAGRMVWLTNVGTQTITLATESASSTAANRFALGALPFDLMAGNSVSIWYDGTSARWRAGAPVATGGGTAVDQTARDAAAAAQSTADGKQDALANASTLAKVTEAAGLPLWDGAAWPGGGGGGTGTVTSVSVTTANGVSGTVATATTTPAITLSLGAITPTSVAATGNVTGSNLSGTNTGDQTTVTGNAGTATALQTARLINGVSFDGTANITAPAVDQTARDAAAAAQSTANAAETPTGAQAKADAAQAYAVQRANHTGTQAATTITQDSTHRFATDAEKTTWNAKQDAITGGATTITTANLTASRALASDTNGKVAVSAVTSTELGYVSGVTSGIQSQITNISPAEYYAGTMTVNIGTLISGTVADLQAVGGTDVDIREATTTGIQVQLDATTVVRLSTFALYGYYAGGAGHYIVVEFWNWTGSAWEAVGQFGNGTAKQWYSFALNNSTAYLSGTNARMRFRHVGSGISSHHLYLDKVSFNYGAPAGVGIVGASSVSFVPTGGIAANNVQSAIGEVDAEKQPLDSDLTSIAALATDAFGRDLLTKTTAADTRTYIGAGTSSFDGAYSSLSGIPSTFTPAAHNQAWSTITTTPTTLSGYGITDAQGLDTDLTALAGLSTTGIVARTGAGTASTRTITGTTDQVTVTNGDGVGGNPTLALPQSIATGSTPQFTRLGVGVASAVGNTILANNTDSNRVLFSGTTKGIRFTHNPTGSVVEGVDNTGTANYQPLYVGGSYVATSVSGTETMRATTTGLGIGTTTPTARVNAAPISGFVPYQSTVATSAAFLADGSFGGGYILKDGTVYGGMYCNAGTLTLGVGTSSGVPIQLVVGASGSIRFAAYGAGTLVTDSSGNVTASSDRRLKDVGAKFTRGLDDVVKIQPRFYTWKPESGMNTEDVNVGFIAQDVQDAIPEAVGTMKTSDTEEDDAENPGKKIKRTKREAAEFLTLSDRPIIAALVNAVKELKAKNDELEARVAKLEAKK